MKHCTKDIIREGFEYELTENFELLNDQHLTKAPKDSTGLFMNKPEFVIYDQCIIQLGLIINKIFLLCFFELIFIIN